MAINTYVQDNLKFYEVYTSAKSAHNPLIRVQKRKKGIKTKAEDQRLEKKLLRFCVEEVAKKDGEGTLWGVIVEKWFNFLLHNPTSHIGQSALSDYYNALKKWTRHLWKVPAGKITRTDIRHIISTLESNKKSKSFQSKMKSTIHQVFMWGIDEGEIKGLNQSPAFGIKVNRQKERQPQILNIEEIRRLLSSAQKFNNPWYSIWATALLTGCRSGELYALTWDDIDFSHDKIIISKSYNKRENRIKSTKSGHWRTVPINSELKKLLLTIRNKEPKNYVLPKLREWQKGNQATELRKFCVSIGITPIRFHDLRACFATQLLNNNIAPATVMKICGWKDLDTMARYIRLAGIEETGATDCLLLTPEEGTEKLVQILKT